MSRVITRLLDNSQQATALWNLSKDDRIYETLPAFTLERVDSRKEVFNRVVDARPATLFINIYLADNPDEYIGVVEVYHIKHIEKTASIGYRFFSKYWGCGYATEAIEEALKIVKEFGISSLKASVLTTHEKSQKVLEKLGFGSSYNIVKQDWGFGGLSDAYVFYKQL